jgi:hypothetical protein
VPTWIAALNSRRGLTSHSTKYNGRRGKVQASARAAGSRIYQRRRGPQNSKRFNVMDASFILKIEQQTRTFDLYGLPW